MPNISLMEISIKKPCHENWDAMTPNEQGAFCGKCVKTVIDFSTKSIDEIKAFFTGREQQKICGRFEEKQLVSLSFDAFFEQFRKFELTKRLAVILFFTFGMWLFGASSAVAQTNAHVKGDVRVEDPKNERINCTKPNPHAEMLMGKVAPVKQDSTKKQEQVPPVKPIMGAVAPVKQPQSTERMKMGKVAPVKQGPAKKAPVKQEPIRQMKMGDATALPPEQKATPKK